MTAEFLTNETNEKERIENSALYMDLRTMDIVIYNGVDDLDEINGHIHCCLLPKLSRNIDEIDNHPEYYDRHTKLDNHFPRVLHLLANMDFQDVARLTPNVLPSLIILYIQRTCPAVWNTPKCKNYVQKLNQVFLEKSGVTLENVLQSSFCNIQNVFDNIIQELNTKLVTEDFKRYPGLIDVYCSLMKDLKVYKVKINAVKIFTISLLLIDDYQNENKVKGLMCCNSIMQHLKEKHFKSGNYYEVLIKSLKSAMHVKDVQITTLVLQCLLGLIKIIPLDAKKKKGDEVFGSMLEQLHLESNLHRKTVCVQFLKEAILVHKVNCVNKRLLKVVLLENIHICCNDAVADILLVDVLECLQVWITHCWCVWQLSTDHKILSALIKLLYVSRKESIATVIQDLIVSLATLCTEDEQKSIYKNLEKSETKSPEFIEKLEEIKSEILKLYE